MNWKKCIVILVFIFSCIYCFNDYQGVENSLGFNKYIHAIFVTIRLSEQKCFLSNKNQINAYMPFHDN